jgi:hypothetical protein
MNRQNNHRYSSLYLQEWRFAMVASVFPQHLTSLLERVGRETIPGLVPSEEVNALRSVRPESGFAGVYASRHGWIAKVKEAGRLMAIPGSRQPTPHQAAAFVVAWYKARFGDSWKTARANRMRPYWRVKYSESYGGWLLTVWANGKAVTVRAATDSGRPTDRPHVFPRRSLAVYYAKHELPKQRRTWAAWRAE